VKTMAYVQVPKDLTKVKNKVMFNLTKRQLICFALAGAVGAPFYLLTRRMLGSTMAASLMVVLVLPFFLFAMYEKDGRPLEKILMMMFRQSVQRPGIRTYQTDNFYKKVQEEIYEKEVLGIGEKESRKAGRKASGRSKRENARKK
jgi:hypothetical protein